MKTQAELDEDAARRLGETHRAGAWRIRCFVCGLLWVLLVIIAVIRAHG